MNQDEINQQEWENPANWGGPKWISVYFSKRDTRTWVPKQIPGLGLWSKKATPNLAHTWGVLSFLGIFLLLYVLAIAIALYVK
jgi:uncharacterized membrane protein